MISGADMIIYSKDAEAVVRTTGFVVRATMLDQIFNLNPAVVGEGGKQGVIAVSVP